MSVDEKTRRAPSRLLNYMQAKIFVFADTNPNTETGKVLVEGGFGWWCESDGVADFEDSIAHITKNTKEAINNE